MKNQNFVSFVVTGVTVRGSRFKIETENHIHAFGINLYRGTVWGILSTGKRKVLRRVFN